MKEIRITVRCTLQPKKHAKILRIQMGEDSKDFAEKLAGLLDGTSPLYIHKPGPDCPIGKCGICGGPITAQVSEAEATRFSARGNVADPRFSARGNVADPQGGR